ncbi:MAG: hypothetical protein AMJ79_02260 [Phycisphaerae bacterium SM23_30]|nr:MAG: hypothetical protein AMJ79_02260 [Phycisphaerae bacterium SM23_30]
MRRLRRKRAKAVSTISKPSILSVNPMLALETLESRLLLNAALPASAGEEDTFKYDWTHTMGSWDSDTGYDVAVDSSGNVLVTGEFKDSVEFNRPHDKDPYASNGGTDIFVTKFNADGSYGWTTTWGGSGFDGGYGVATDSMGNVFVTGYFRDTVDFDPSADDDIHASKGDQDIFVTKLKADGSYAWTRTFGSSGYDAGNGVATDSAGNVFITGYFVGTVDFNFSAGKTDYHSSRGERDVFIVKLNADGSYGWSETFGGSGYDGGYSIAVDSEDRILVAGGFMNTVDFGTGYYTSNGQTDIFVTKMDGDRGHIWTRTIGGEDLDNSYGVAVDAAGNVFATGYFAGPVDFDPTDGTDNHYSNGGRDIFVSKLNADGSYEWTATFGSDVNDTSYGVAVNSQGDVFSTGLFYGEIDFDPTEGTDRHTAGDFYDVFITKLHGDGCYGWTATFGSDSADVSNGVAVDSEENVFVTGAFFGVGDFDPTDGTDNHESEGIGDIFVTKLKSNAAPTIGALTAHPDPVTFGDTLALTAHDVYDSDGAVASVQFFHDSNRNNKFDPLSDTLLFEDTDGDDGWSWSGSTGNFPYKNNVFFARVLDNGGARSSGVSTAVRINDPPTIDSLWASPDPVTLGYALMLDTGEVSDYPNDNVTKVEFYRDANDNDVLDIGIDILLKEDTDRSDGWSCLGSTSGLSVGTYHFFARAQDDDGAWSDVVTTSGTIEYFHITVGSGYYKTVNYIDSNGDNVKLKFKLGIAELYFDGESLSKEVQGNTVTILGQTDLLYIQTLNTDHRSSLSFNVKKGDNGEGDGQTTFTGLTGGSLGKFYGKRVDLLGDINLTGFLNSLTLDDIDPNISITTQAASAKGFKFKADQIHDGVAFNISDTIKSFQASTISGGSVTAEIIKSLKVAQGSLGADVFTQVGEIMKVYALGAIEGDVDSATFIKSITSKSGGLGADANILARLGGIKTISTAQSIAGRIMADDSINKITSKAGDFTGAVQAGEDIGRIKARNFLNATISASSNIKKVQAKGDFHGSFILAGYDMSYGTTQGVSDGEVGTVFVKGTFSESYISAGVLPPVPDLLIVLPNVVPPYTGLGYTGNIGKVRFGAIDQNATDDFGLFAATNIKPVKVGNTTYTETDQQLHFNVEDNLG